MLPPDDAVKLCVIGLGYVGLPLALAFSRHHPVIGFDIDAERIAELRSGVDRTLEATPEELRTSGQLHYTFDPDELAACNVYIVTVPSPIDLSQQPDLGAIRSASELIAKRLDRGDVVIYESTVYPGVTEEVCLPLLERSGLVAGRDFALGYSPERINPGDKTHKLKDIRKITAGLTPRCAEFVDRLYSRIIEAGIFRAASIATAEMAKVVENSQRDVNIALMNELAIMCDHLGLRTFEVLEAAATKWNFLPFSPGLVGGHCVGVDPYYLIHKSQRVGHHPDLIISGRRINNSMGTYIARKVTRMMTQRDIEVTRANVLILGVSFKENCPDLRNSKVADIYRYLESMVASIEGFDPLVRGPDSERELGIPLIGEPRQQHYDCIVVNVPHDEFLRRGADWVRSLCREPRLVYDIKSAFVPDLIDKTL